MLYSYIFMQWALSKKWMLLKDVVGSKLSNTKHVHIYNFLVSPEVFDLVFWY